MSVTISQMNSQNKSQVQLQLKEKQLAEALKLGDKAGQAKAYYQLGVLYAKKDIKKAKEYFNQAVALKADNEISAYALKERTLYYMGSPGETEKEKLVDLKAACEMLDTLKEAKEDSENKERRRCYLYYGEALMEAQQPKAAVLALRRSLQLGPDNIRTVRALLQAQSSVQRYKNIFECMEDIGFGPQVLSFLEDYTKDSEMLPLWLEAARIGSLDILQYLASHSPKFQLYLFTKAPTYFPNTIVHDKSKDEKAEAKSSVPILQEVKVAKDQVIKPRVFKEHEDYIETLSVTAEGTEILSFGHDSTIRLSSLLTGTSVRVLKDLDVWISAITLSSDGKKILSAEKLGDVIQLRSVFSTTCEKELKGHTERVTSLMMSPDGLKAISGSEDNKIRLWSLVSGECEMVLKGHTDAITSLAWSVDGLKLLSGSKDGTVRLWSLANGQCEYVLRGHEAWVNSVALSKDGKLALSGSSDGTSRLWDLNTGTARIFSAKNPNLYSNCIYTVSFSDNGQWIVSGGVDNCLRIWSIATGACLEVLNYKSPVRAIHMVTKHNQQYIIAGQGNGEIEIRPSLLQPALSVSTPQNTTTVAKEVIQLTSPADRTLEIPEVPSLIYENKQFELVVRGKAGLQRKPAPSGIEVKLLQALFQNTQNQRKLLLPWNDPIVKWIRGEGGHSSTICDSENNTALHYAAREDHVDLVDFLEKYEDYSTQNKKGLTPLLVAAQHGKLRMLRLLMSKAPQTVIGKDDLLSILIANEHLEILEDLLKNQKEYETLLLETGKFHLQNSAILDRVVIRQAAIGQLYRRAIDVQSQKMLVFLIKTHAEGVHILYKGQSPLHYAVLTEFREGIFVLVEGGGNVGLRNQNQQTALELAKKEVLDFVPYLTNLEGRIQQHLTVEAKSLMEQNRLVFVEQCLIVFLRQNLSGEKTLLQNKINLNRLKGVLFEVIGTQQYDFLFSANTNQQLAVLVYEIVQMLLQKIERNQLIQRTGVARDLLFEKSNLLSSIKAVLDSPWQKKTLADFKGLYESLGQDKGLVEIQTLKENKEHFSAKMFNPIQILFCEHFERQLDEIYIHFRTLIQSTTVHKLDQKEVKENLSATKDQPLNYNISLLNYIRQCYGKKEAQRMASLFQKITPSERTHFIQYTAEHIAYKYGSQIQRLMLAPEGLQQFADCAVMRFVDYITSEERVQYSYEPSILEGVMRKLKNLNFGHEIPLELVQYKSLFDLFLEGVLQQTVKFPMEKQLLKTFDTVNRQDKTLQDKWCAKEIFENTGIITQSGERYIHAKVENLRYGYCQGTVKEAEKRGYYFQPKIVDNLLFSSRQTLQSTQYGKSVVASTASLEPTKSVTAKK
jgi:WD40 repeat protein/ankyrin repeat protein